MQNLIAGEKYDINNMDFVAYKFFTNKLDLDKKSDYAITLNNRPDENKQDSYSLKSNTQNGDDLEI